MTPSHAEPPGPQPSLLKSTARAPGSVQHLQCKYTHFLMATGRGWVAGDGGKTVWRPCSARATAVQQPHEVVVTFLHRPGRLGSGTQGGSAVVTGLGGTRLSHPPTVVLEQNRTDVPMSCKPTIPLQVRSSYTVSVSQVGLSAMIFLK